MTDRDSAARAAYAEDVRRLPLHHDGTPRPAWDALSDFAKETWRRNPTPRNLTGWQPNGLPHGVTLSDFTGFCLSPVRETGHEGVTVCHPAEADFWSVYGFNRDAEEWQIVHDAERDDAGEALARIVDATGEQVEYRDLDRAYANTRLPDLCELIAQRLADEGAVPDHPLAVIRDRIAAALDARGN